MCVCVHVCVQCVGGVYVCIMYMCDVCMCGVVWCVCTSMCVLRVFIRSEEGGGRRDV